MTMLNNPSPYAVTAPGVRRGAAVFLARLARLINQWIAAVIAHRERQAALVALRHLSDRDKTSAPPAVRSVMPWRRGHGSDCGCKIPSDPDGTRTLANQPGLARA